MWPDSEGLGQNGCPGRTSSGSEVVAVDEHVMGTSQTPAAVSKMNVTNFSKVHIGPKFVTVTQNVHNSEVTKGQFLGLEIVSPNKARRLRCSVAVFVCWALVVVSGLVFYLIHVVIHMQGTRLDIGLKEPWYLRRGDWQAMPAYQTDFLNLPIKYVLIGHSVTPYCTDKYKCIAQVIAIQQNHLRRGYNDIGPNYLVSGDGLVFEGRGANVIGAMVSSWNSKSISIMFLGNYVHDSPKPEAFDHVNSLLEILLNKGVLTQDYVLYGHCQVSHYIISPGPNLMKKLNNLTQWSSEYENMCLPE